MTNSEHTNRLFKALLATIPVIGGPASSLWGDYSGEVLSTLKQSDLRRPPRNLFRRLSALYRQKFAAISLYDILRNFSEIEDSLELEVFEQVSEALTTEGFQQRGSFFTRGATLVRLESDRKKILGGYSLSINIEVVSETSKLRPREPVSIEGLGRIQSFQLNLPEHPVLAPRKLEAVLLARFTAAYTELERKLLASAGQLESEVFAPLWRLVRNHLEEAGKGDLNGRYWLILATDDFVVYFFDGKELERTVSHYKRVEENGVVGKSPLEMLSALWTRKFEFQESLAKDSYAVSTAEKEAIYLSLPWAKAKYRENAPLIHLAEMKLYASPEYSGLVPCSARGYYFVVGCPTEIEDDIMPEIIKIAGDIEDQFTRSLRVWSAYVGMLSATYWKE